MIIDGKALSDTLITKLADDVADLKKRGIKPTLRVILIGENPASLSYIRQKEKAASRIGADVMLIQKATISPKELAQLISEANADGTCHGIIIQRPLPAGAGDMTDILGHVTPQKDIDGFVPNSGYTAPVAKAVVLLLRVVWEQLKTDLPFDMWLSSRNIAVIGKGETAGKPVSDYLRKLHCTTSIIDTKTPHPEEIMAAADIIVSCVGKERVVKAGIVKTGVILISVGIWRDATGKLRGDYDDDEIAGIASYYTPTPGGVGPVNVAVLMENLVIAAKRTVHNNL